MNAKNSFRQNLLPGLLFGLVTAFFVWRVFSLGHWLHIGLAALYGLLTVLVILGSVPGRYRSNALNLGFSFIFLDLVFAQIPIREFAGAMAEANFWLIIPSMVALAIHLVFRIWRWQWILKPMGEISFGPAFRAGMIGIGGNMVLPARAGEFLRAYAIGRATGISKTGAFATLVVERIFDGLTVLFFLILLVLFVGVDDPQLRQWGLAGAAFYTVALVGVIVFMARRPWFEWLVSRFVPHRFVDRVMDLLSGFASGLDSLRDLKQLGMVTLLSLLTWLFIPLSFHPIIVAFDYGAPVPVWTSILVLAFLAFGLTIPSGPGGLGIFELAGVAALTIAFQVAGTPLSEETLPVATACIVLLHLTQAGPEALLGIWAFYKEGLTPGDLQTGQQLADKEVIVE